MTRYRIAVCVVDVALAVFAGGLLLAVLHLGMLGPASACETRTVLAEPPQAPTYEYDRAVADELTAHIIEVCKDPDKYAGPIREWARANPYLQMDLTNAREIARHANDTPMAVCYGRMLEIVK